MSAPKYWLKRATPRVFIWRNDGRLHGEGIVKKIEKGIREKKNNSSIVKIDIDPVIENTTNCFKV